MDKSVDLDAMHLTRILSDMQATGEINIKFVVIGSGNLDIEGDGFEVTRVQLDFMCLLRWNTNCFEGKGTLKEVRKSGF